MSSIIRFIGPHGSGKTTIADAVRDRTNSIHIGIADVSESETVSAVAMLGRLARLLSVKQDKTVIVDFVGKNEETRNAFGDSDLTVWVDTIPDADDWERPEESENIHKIVNTGDAHTDAMPTRAITIVRKYGLLDWKPEQTLMSGTFQTWNSDNVEEYKALVSQGPVVIGVKHSIGMKPENSLFFNQIRTNILSSIPEAKVILLPNIVNFKDVD